jgi:hypothetical protein
MMTRPASFCALVLGAAFGLSGCDRVAGWFGADQTAQPASSGRETADEGMAEADEPTDGEQVASPPNIFAGSGTDAAEESVDAEPSMDIEIAERVLVQAVPVAPNALYSVPTTVRFRASPVPVIGPAEEASEGGQQFSDSFRATRDGFFATLNSPYGPVALSGTQRFARRADMAAAGADYPMRLEEGASGVLLVFGRYGVDYLLEFECVDPCPSMEEAARFADNLIVVGGGQ